jgi:hypothetical protein
VRIRLDISNSADFAWDIDIKKSRARPPEALRGLLRSIAINAREMGRGVFAHRGRFGIHQADPNLRNVWLTKQQKDSVKYVIDRDHPIVARAIQNAGQDGTAIQDMLRLVEETVPVQRIWLDMTSDTPEIATASGNALRNTIEPVLVGLWGYLRHTVGLDPDQARRQLLGTEPFHAFPELVNELASRLESSDR